MVQLISYAEMLASATNICSTLREIPCIGDGDTGYGNSVNVKRTVKGYAQVGTWFSSRAKNAALGVVPAHPCSAASFGPETEPKHLKTVKKCSEMKRSHC